ncbi:MAG: Hexuronate transporter [Bryobacteraceae bacterium]|nr:Hexuronate transporter [Bryobacteraceae bacterium]
MAPAFRWTVAALLFCATALSFFDRQVLSVLAPRILADLRIGNVEYSNAVSAFTLAYSAMFTLGGRLVDYWGTRAGLGAAVAFWTAASLLHTGVRGAWDLTAYRFLLGVGEGGCFPGAARGILEWFPARERALAMGIATTGGSAMGAVLAPPLIVWVSSLVGWRGAFLATGAIGVVWVAVWFLLYRKPDAPPEPSAAPLETPWPMKRLVARREVWGLLIARFLFDPVFYFYMFWIPQYLSRERGASLEEIGKLAWIPFLTLGISSLLGGALSDSLVRRGWSINRARKAVMAAAAFLTPVSILALVAPDSFWAVTLLAVLMFAHGFWMTNYMTMIGDLFPASSVGTVVGLTGTAGGVAGFLSSLAVGRIVEAVSFTPVMLACGVLYPAALAVLLIAIPRIERLANTAAAA